MCNIENSNKGSGIVQKSTVISAVNEILSGHQPGFELVAETRPDAIERFVVLHVRGLPRLLLPPAQKVMKTAISSFRGGSRHSAMTAAVLKAASLAGGPLASVTSNLSMVSSQPAAQSALRELLCRVLGRNDFHMALRLSFGRPNAKTVVMAISDGGEVLCYAKFGSESLTNSLVAHESTILEQFEAKDLPLLIPRHLYSGIWCGKHNVLITTPLDLCSLKGNTNKMHEVADALATQTFVTNSTLATSAYWRDIVESAKKMERGEPRSQALHSLVVQIEKFWGNCRFDFGASHGDWTHANIGMVDGQFAALDWERCTMLAPRGIDVAHFAVCDTSFSFFKQPLSIDKAAETVRQYLSATHQSTDNAHPLVLLALLEMVRRFHSAHTFGLQSDDLKFGPALNAGIKKWAT